MKVHNVENISAFLATTIELFETWLTAHNSLGAHGDKHDSCAGVLFCHSAGLQSKPLPQSLNHLHIDVFTLDKFTHLGHNFFKISELIGAFV